MVEKPLGRKAYGSIPHISGSRVGPAEHAITHGQEYIATRQARRGDRVIVTEKLDGSNVAIARIGNDIVPLQRSGYPAFSSPYRQHQLFHWWVIHRAGLWESMLSPGDVLHGELMLQAHGTFYEPLPSPFFAFDFTRDGQRVPWNEMVARCQEYDIPRVRVLADGPACMIASAIGLLNVHGFKTPFPDDPEGAVWRVETNGQFNFMTKYVLHSKIDGKYLPERQVVKGEIWQVLRGGKWWNAEIDGGDYVEISAGPS